MTEKHLFVPIRHKHRSISINTTHGVVRHTEPSGV